jgi:cell division protein FtsW
MNFFKKYFKGDASIWGVIVGLSVFSLLAVYSSTGTLAYRWTEGNTAFYVIRHAGFLAVGLAATFILHMFPYKYYARISQWLLIIVVPLLLFTLAFGVDENDAARRISLFGLTFQTSDLAKMALVMYLAQKLAFCQEHIADFKKTVLPMFIIIGAVCVLILPANFSTAALLFLTCVILLFIARIPMKQLAGLCGVALLAGMLLVGSLYGLQKMGVENRLTQRASTWMGRMDRFMDSDAADAELAENYQATQARIAVGTVGILGRGPGNSVQRNFLPHPYSDFIFAIIIEEYGIVGAIIVLFLYMNLLYRTALIVRRCEKTFPAFLAVGLALSIVLQALVHMSVCVGWLPVTGQPLPLVSMGGTSILFTGAALGVILGISREVKNRDEERIRKAEKEQQEAAPPVRTAEELPEPDAIPQPA